MVKSLRLSMTVGRIDVVCCLCDVLGNSKMDYPIVY